MMRDLTINELLILRGQIKLCSLFANDYENEFDISRSQVQDFFDGYADYLEAEMIADGHTDNEFFDLLPEYDSIENLYDYYNLLDPESWCNIQVRESEGEDWDTTAR